MLADGIPILMRLINGKRFEPGPFTLGRFGPFLGSLAVLWVVFITVRIPSLVQGSPVCPPALCSDCSIAHPSMQRQTQVQGKGVKSLMRIDRWMGPIPHP